MILILLMFIPILLMAPLLEIGGKSVGESLACFLLGFFILSQDEVLDKLAKYRISLTAIWILLMAMRYAAFMTGHLNSLGWDIQYRMLSWAGMIAILGLGKRYLNFNNKFTKYFSTAAFPIYFFHQTVLVIVAFFILKLTKTVPLQIILIMTLGFVLTVSCYEIFRRFSATCFIFGIKKKGVIR